ncbi:hypothetical protein [Sulfuracidifex tepidarius]|nr:hypothetical protein [Sulfuracidifex tepidarius]
MIDYSSVPSEIQGYADSFQSLIALGMELLTTVLVIGYVTQNFSVLASVSIVIGASFPIILFLYFRTRKV